MSAPFGPLGTRGASLRIRVGERFSLEAEIGSAPLRLAAVGLLVASILLSVPPIIRAARERTRVPLPDR